MDIRVKNDKKELRNFSHYFIIFNKICSVFAITSKRAYDMLLIYRKKKFLVKYITLDIKISLRLRLHDFWNVRGIIMVWFNHELYGFQ